jgi:hydroxyacid-oxoacid transhydrogenase
MMANETVFTMDTSSIKYGPGATREVGSDMAALGVKRVMVVTDPRLSDSEPVTIALDSLKAEGLEAVLFDRTVVEPTDASFMEAAAFATEGKFDGFLPVGGGSAIDTAKAANLYSTYPAEFLTYVNAPIGEARPVPGKLKPLIAIPTTAGTGSETTGVAVFDFTQMHAKTAIAHRALRPVMGIIDPNNTRTMPRMVAACSALDVLCHAIESYTALPYSERPAAESPKMRPSYQGSNPISDIWAGRALEMMSRNIDAALDNPDDEHARGQMMLAAAFAGIGFGNAGVHLPHGMSYPIAGMVESYFPEGYPHDHPMVPHGMSVIMTAPAVFRYTAPATPQRHLQSAAFLGADITGASPDDAGDILSKELVRIMKLTGMPNGLSALGYNESHIPGLVKGTLPQHRVTKLSPRPAGEAELAQLFRESMTVW